MNNKSNEAPIRGYHRHSKARYAEYIPDIDISIGLYFKDDSMISEFRIIWEMIGGKLSPILHMTDDSWKIIPEFNDLFDKMSKSTENISEEDFAKMLNEIGIVDLTKYEK
jgi:hypothetical protein